MEEGKKHGTNLFGDGLGSGRVGSLGFFPLFFSVPLVELEYL